jgi:lysophospholipase L1-like esterase
MRRSLARNLLLATVSLLAVALATEFVLRTTHLFNARVAFSEPDPEIGYRFTPGYDYWFFGENDHAIEGRINALGWRDHERKREKPVRCYRVAVIGDSFVEAFQVELDSTFVAIAERRLNALHVLGPGGGRVECMNFGRSGMTTTEELIVLNRDVLPCEPDAVVVLFTPGNDIADVNPATSSGALRPFPSLEPGGLVSIDMGFAHTRAYQSRAIVNGVKQRSALVSLLAERYNAWRRAPPPRARAGERTISREHSLCTAQPDSVYLRQYAMNKRLLAEMAGACAARGARLWLMSVPVVRGPAEAASLRALDPTFDPGFFDRDLAALADSTGAGFVPLAGRFEASARAGGAPLFWAHWSYAGHRVVADALVEALAPSGARE